MAIGDTRTTNVRLATFEPRVREDDFGAGIGRSLQGLSSSIDSFGEELKQKQDQTRRYAALETMTRMNGEMEREFADLTKNAAPGGDRFVETTAKWAEGKKKQFLASVAPELRDEFGMRWESINQSYLTQGAAAQTDMQVAYFNSTHADWTNEVGSELVANPDLLGTFMTQAQQRIMAAPISTEQKAEAAKLTGQVLTEMSFRGALERSLSQQPGVYDAEGLTQAMITVESNGNPNAKNPGSSAAGLGQFIESTWNRLIKQYRPDVASGRSDDEINALRMGEATVDLQVEMINRFIEENQNFLAQSGIQPTAGNTYLAHFLGPAGAVRALKASGETPITEVVSAGAISANAGVYIEVGGQKKFFKDFTVNDLRVWSQQKMAMAPREAGTTTPGTVAGYPDPFSDPRYASLSLEQKLQMSDAVSAKITRDKNAAETAKKLHQQQSYETAAQQVERGEIGQTEIDRLYRAGDLSFEAREKLTGVLVKRNELDSYEALGLNNLGKKGFIYDHTNGEHRKQIDAIMGPKVVQAMLEGDMQVFYSGVLPVVQKWGDISGPLKTALVNLTGSTDSKQVAFGLNAINNIAAVSPNAARRIFGEDLVMDAYAYGRVTQTGRLDDEATKFMLERGTVQWHEQKKRFDEIASKQELDVNDALSRMRSYWKVNEGIELPTTFMGASAFESDYAHFYREALNRTGGDPEAAKDVAAAMLSTQWGTFRGEVMLAAPQLVGLPDITLSGKEVYDKYGVEGITGYDWMDKEVEKEYNLPSGTKIIYMATPQTFQRAQAGMPVPYYIYYEETPGQVMPLYEVMEFAPPKDLMSIAARTSLGTPNIPEWERE